MNNKKLIAYLLIGICASLLMITADFLLGYVDPTPLANNFMLVQGYTSISLWRPILSMALAIIAMPFYLFPLYSLKHTISEKFNKYQKIYLISVPISALPWLFLHAYYCMSIYTHRFAATIADNHIASEISSQLVNAFLPIIFVTLPVIALPYILHMIAVIRNQTLFPRWLFVTNPIAIFVFFNIIKYLLPSTPFVSGIEMALMNIGMLIWFSSSLLYIRKNI